jgi:tetratricopeptide (TPR) repeat protein
VNYEAGRFRLPWAAMTIFFVITEANHQLGQHEAELAAARTAASLHPDNREIACMSLRALAAMGDVASIESLLPRVEALPASAAGRPLANLLVTVAGELAYHGQPAHADRLLRRLVAWQRSRPIEVTDAGGSHFDFARALYLAGEYDEACTLLEELIESDATSPLFLGYAAASAAKMGHERAAADLRRRLDRLERRFDHGETPYARALVAAQLGDTARAIDLVRQSLQRGMPPDLVSIHTDLMLSPLWTSAEFLQLLAPKD